MTLTRRNEVAILQSCQQGGLPYPSSSAVIVQTDHSSAFTEDVKEKTQQRSWPQTDHDNHDKSQNTRQPPTIKPKDVRRGVAFDENANASYTTVHMSKDDVTGLWYSRAEYQDFKADYVRAAKRIIRSDRLTVAKGNQDSISTIVQRLHSACYNDNHCKEDIVQSSDFKRLQSIVSLSAKNDHDVRDKNVDNVDRVGMEKVTIPKLRINKKKSYEELVEKILSIQETHRRIQHWQQKLTFDEEQIISEITMQAIALCAQQKSEPASLFAALIAESLATSTRD